MTARRPRRRALHRRLTALLVRLLDAAAARLDRKRRPTMITSVIGLTNPAANAVRPR